MKISEEFERFKELGTKQIWDELTCDMFNLCKILMQDIGKLRDAVEVYYSKYMQDEADDIDCCVCGEKQHQAAKNVRDALAETDPDRNI